MSHQPADTQTQLQTTRRNDMIAEQQILHDSLYERLGGEASIHEFVTHFYKHMCTLEQAKPLLELHKMPLEEAANRLYAFLSGWLGGPPLFEQQHGEPRLRRRHMHVAIGDDERDQWMLCASRARKDMGWAAAESEEFMQKLHEMANHMRNQGPLPGGQHL